MKQIILLFTILIGIISLSAQPSDGYYSSALNKSDAELKTALFEIMSNPYQLVSYGDLYEVYKTSDVNPDGTLWDMYSTCTWVIDEKKCGNYKNVCDCYNREHSIPKSWFDDRYPMYSDAHHLYPTDGRVNGQRGNDPFGECANGTSLSSMSLGRSGTSTFPGYSGRVFEPVDEYKGDFARTYFYFATRYEDIMTSMQTSASSFAGNTYPALNNWSVNLFLKWHRQDPVSQKEITRNNAVEVHQKNRNAFIDHPILAEHIWGELKGNPWKNSTLTRPAELLARIYYNPASRLMTTSTDLGEMRYEVMNISGVRVLSGTLMGGDAVSVSSLNRGVYFFRLSGNDIKVVKKFIIQ